MQHDQEQRRQDTHVETGRVVVVSLRLPIPPEEGQPLAAGGVLSALLPALREHGGLWVGWSGEVAEQPETRERTEQGVDLLALDLTPEAVEGHYHGFSNATLWPLLHGLESRSRYDEEAYRQYREVNRRFALNVRARLLPGETVWVHDYQFMPLGQELRRLGWEGPVGYFHHVPVPGPNAWRRIPHAAELARALGEFSHIGVQTQRDADHLRAILGRRAPTIEVHPIQVDAAGVRAMAETVPPPLDEAAIDGRTVLFGVDRLDYTKGLPLRLEAWEQVLERRPDLRDHAILVQWAAPSREGVDEYRQEREAVEAIAARIERRFGGPRSPLQLVLATHSAEETAAALQRADIALVTSVADGMNLVAKEFASLHSAERPGVLVLSDGCGSVEELGAATVVDRRSIAAIADGIERAIDMPAAERAGRSYALREVVDARSSLDWARRVTRRIVQAHRAGADEAERCASWRHRRSPRSSVTRLALPADLQARVAGVHADMARTRMVERLWRRDTSLWPAPSEAIAARLGWLSADDWLAQHLPGLREFALEVEHAGYTTALVLGMGGSSAAARMFAHAGESSPRGLRVHVLDSTVPAAVRSARRRIDPGRTLFIAVSKSGDTIETRAFLDAFWDEHPEPRDFVAVTDPGTALHEIALARGFRAAFLNPPDIGGRFSALSYPGLLPAALAGLDLDLLATHARAMERACRRADLDAYPGARLAATLAEAARSRRGALFIEADPRLPGLDDWLAQLVAESTGKQGRGLLPVRVGQQASVIRAGDTVFIAGQADPTRLEAIEQRGARIVRCDLGDRHALGAEIVRWQVGVALACSLMGVNAFDEPDVALAKRATAAELAGVPRHRADVPESRPLAELLPELSRARYIAVHAYMERSWWRERLLGDLQEQLAERFGVPVPVEFGPQLLHATGQYYKGGPGEGIVLQVVDPGVDLPIAGRDYGFAALLRAQARGDASALRSRGHRVTETSLAALQSVGEAVETRAPRGAR